MALLVILSVIADNSTIIFLALGAIGVPTLIGFVGTLWYQSNRQKELIDNLYKWKQTQTDKIAALEKELNTKIDNVDKGIMPVIAKMQATLEHLDSTLKDFGQEIKTLKNNSLR